MHRPSANSYWRHFQLVTLTAVSCLVESLSPSHKQKLQNFFTEYCHDFGTSKTAHCWVKYRWTSGWRCATGFLGTLQTVRLKGGLGKRRKLTVDKESLFTINKSNFFHGCGMPFTASPGVWRERWPIYWAILLNWMQHFRKVPCMKTLLPGPTHNWEWGSPRLKTDWQQVLVPGTEGQLNSQRPFQIWGQIQKTSSGLQIKSASTLLDYNGGGKGERHYMIMNLLGGHWPKWFSSADGAEMWAVLT